MLPSDVADGQAGEAEHVLDSREAGTKFLRGSSLRLIAFIGGLLLALGSTPLAVHHLGPTRWGQYATVSSLMFVVAAITEGGLGQMGIRELSVGGESSHEDFMRDLIGMRIVLTAAGAVAALAFALGVGYPAVEVEGTAIACAGLLATNLAGTFALPLWAGLRLGWLALNDFLPQLAVAVVMVSLVLAGAGLLPFFAAPVAGGLTAFVLTISVVRRRLNLLPTFRLSRWRELLTKTLIYAAATATGAMYFRIVLVATSLLSTKAQTGYYGLAFRILELTAAVPFLLVSSAFPILVRSAWNDPPRLRYALQRLVEGSLILGAWFALCLVVGAPLAVHILDLGSHSFDPSIHVLRILGSAIPATFILATFSYALLSLHLYRQLLVANGVVIVLAIVLSAALIPPLGAEGAALVTLTLEVVLMVAYLIALVRSRPDVRPGVERAERIALCVALAFATGIPLLGHPFIGVLASSAVLFLSLVAMKAIPAELLMLLRRTDTAPPAQD